MPLKRGSRTDRNYSSVANLFTQSKIEPPQVPSARVSKYQKLKELESENCYNPEQERFRQTKSKITMNDSVSYIPFYEFIRNI